MPKSIPLQPQVPWVELIATDEDWKTFDPGMLVRMLEMLFLIRFFEETMLTLWSEGLVHGPVHTSIGQEGASVASILNLRPDDHINGAHRGHHQFLAKSLLYVDSKGSNEKWLSSQSVFEMVRGAAAEIMGLDQGFGHGRGGSMHLRWGEAGALGTNAIVGGGVPLAAGTAWAHKHAGTDAVAVTYFGDGAVNIGSTLETMNLAAAWKLPLLFFIENNQYAVSTTVAEATGEARLSGRGPGFGIASWKVDGMDPVASYLAMQEALKYIRAGNGPAIIEADCYRYLHANGPMPGSAFGYRSKEEEAAWRARDPIDRTIRGIIERGILTPEQVEELRAGYKAMMDRIASDLTEPTEEKKRRVRPELWPSPNFRDVGIRGDLSELNGMREEEADSFKGQLGEQKFIDVIADVIGRRMETDDRVMLLGEDVHRLRGGTNGATRSVQVSFPDRVLGTPISENAFFGLGGGIAMDGRYRPIVEFMYPDFMMVAADQVFNQVGKARHMFGGELDVPLVLRTKVAIGTGYGSQHSLEPAGLFATSPGWRIAAPSTAFDYIGVMNAALACNDPVLIIEHVDLYQTLQMAPKTDLDFIIPPGRAVVRRKGARATVLTYLSMVQKSLEAIERIGADIELVDLRWLDRASIDWETIEASVRKTNNVIIVEQGARGTSYGGWLADEIQRRLFDWLDAPITRVTGGEASPSISKVLERAAFTGTEEIEAALRDFLAPTA